MNKTALNNTWNYKVSDHQNDVTQQRGGNNLLNKVESHHQLIKGMSGVSCKELSPKPNTISPKKPTARNAKRSPQLHFLGQLRIKLHYICYPPPPQDVEGLTSVIILQLLHGPIWLNNWSMRTSVTSLERFPT